MAKYTAIYTASWSVDVEADSYDEAMDIFQSMSNHEITDGQLLEGTELYIYEVYEEI